MSVIPINFNQITPIINASILTSIRISGFFIVSPFFSQLDIPANVKIIMIFLLSFVFSTVIPHPNFSSEDIFNVLGAIICFQESLIGIAMGLILKITFEVLNLTGQMIGSSMQLNFAQVYSPSDKTQTNVIGSFYQVFGMLVFISLHGPLLLLMLVYKSFQLMPLANSHLGYNQIKSIIDFSKNMFVYSLLLALPVMTTILLINIGMAVMSRLATTFNIFTVGFPVIIFTGLITLVYSLPYSLINFDEIIKNTIHFIMHWEVVR